MKGALPYYRWHWRDYRADRKVQRMSYIERGLYRELLDECWAEGYIPNNIEALADICNCPKQVLEDSWQVLSTCFTEVEPGILVNERLSEERTEKDLTRARRAISGALGGKSKALASTCHIALAEQEHKQSSSTEDDLRKQTATQLRDICRQVLGVDFNKNLSQWSKQKLTDLETDHKGFALVRAFTDWANDNRLSPPEAPAAAFLSVSDIYLKPILSIKSGVSGLTAMEGTDDELEKLCTALYAVGRQLFPEKMQNVLRELLGRFEASEILDAWKEYTAGMDDTDLKYAPKKFCEGGVSIILTRRADLEKARKDQELLGRLMEQRQAEVAAEDAVEEEPMEDLMRAE